MKIMLNVVMFISFGFAALFAVMQLILLLYKTKKKSLKVRKKVKARRRFYGVAAGIFLLAGIILKLLTLPAADVKEFISDTLPVDSYKEAAGKYTQERAAEYLPVEIFALGNDYYVRTETGDVYAHLQKTTVETDEKGKETETKGYQSGLIFQNALQVSGGKDLVAVLGKRGTLKVSGAFEYQTYEKDSTYFQEEVYAQNCTYVDATENTLFYVENGDLYSAGYNAFGKLGDGTERNRLEGAMVLENVASVSSGETHTLVVDAYGNLYGFGDNSYSEMGNRTTAQSTTPEKLMAGVKQAEAGRYFSVVLTKNGEVYVAGRNDKGQLGTGDARDYATYIKILEGITEISVNKNSCAALSASGTLYVWGDNSAHQLGIGGEVITEPTRLAADVYDVAMGENSMGIIKLNRDVVTTGTARKELNNEYAQTLWAFDATVPESKLYRETVEMPTRPE